MTFEFVSVLKAACIGIGGTVALDLWAVVLKVKRAAPGTNWAMVGRWLGLHAARAIHDDAIAA
ncbi:MAG: DUF2938 family protein [Proteobacteria bacterium]|nr:DUF2938 family protein [Pseudomonadota bacterium]